MNKWLRSNFDGSTVRNLLAMAECFCLALFFITIDRYYEIKDEKNGNR